MERIIKFKAKSIIRDNWLYGSLVKSPSGTYIEWYEDSICNREEVNPSTVCQYTGLKDENGEEVWEHDILDSPLLRGEVVFYKGCYHVKKDNGPSFSFSTLFMIDSKMCTCREVGNKFDRKEGRK